MNKEIKGEKYIYLLMGYQLAKANGGSINIGNDNGYVGGQQFYRHFTITKYNNETLLIEKKNHVSFADFSKVYLIRASADKSAKVYIYEYINESGENGSKNWVH